MTTMVANRSCMSIMHQPELPKSAKNLRKFDAKNDITSVIRLISVLHNNFFDDFENFSLGEIKN